MTTTAEHIDKAADLIEQRGWTQGQNQDKQGRLCILGALDCVHGFSRNHSIGTIEFLKDLTPFISLWNDDPRQTKERVVKFLRKAAGLSRSEDRHAYLDKEIAGWPGWGAALSVMAEERESLTHSIQLLRKEIRELSIL